MRARVGQGAAGGAGLTRIERLHEPITLPVATGGHALARRLVESYRKALPDVQVEVEILVEAGARVAWQRTLRATHSGAFLGFPATGRSIVWRDMVVSRFEEGLMVEDWVITDLAERSLRARKGSARG